jgi:beta-lactamase regulating signal transducer with metallopeptidase domain
MPEPIAPVLRGVEVHLVFASLVWIAAWALTSSPRVTATTKYWIWVATSLNFVLPLGVLLARLWTPNVSWLDPLEDFGNAVSRSVIAALAGVWALGALLMLARLWLRAGAGAGRPDAPGSEREPAQPPSEFLAGGIPVRFEADGAAPAVAGLLRPRISLPAGIGRLLTAPELDAVMIHELTHARRRDNLIRLVHEAGVCAFWFHPFVWLTGSRLALYRELSCDESVLRMQRGRDLVSALAKLASPADPLLLRAMASSYVSQRVEWLTSAAPDETRPAASARQALVFGAVLLSGILGAAFQTRLMSRAAAGEFCSRVFEGNAGSAAGADHATIHSPPGKRRFR